MLAPLTRYIFLRKCDIYKYAIYFLAKMHLRYNSYAPQGISRHRHIASKTYRYSAGRNYIAASHACLGFCKRDQGAVWEHLCKHSVELIEASWSVHTLASFGSLNTLMCSLFGITVRKPVEGL